jgi:hypothetical protein
VRFGRELGGLMMVIAGFYVMGVSQMRMMMGLLVMPLLMCLGCFVMMLCGLLVVFGRLHVMFFQGARHGRLRLCPTDPGGTIPAPRDRAMMDTMRQLAIGPDGVLLTHDHRLLFLEIFERKK